jgi:hypothetical protein
MQKRKAACLKAVATATRQDPSGQFKKVLIELRFFWRVVNPITRTESHA